MFIREIIRIPVQNAIQVADGIIVMIEIMTIDRQCIMAIIEPGAVIGEGRLNVVVMKEEVIITVHEKDTTITRQEMMVVFIREEMAAPNQEDLLSVICVESASSFRNKLRWKRREGSSFRREPRLKRKLLLN